MRKTKFPLFGVSKTIGFAIAATLVVALFWATTAQAQTPADDQYGGPNAVKGSSKAGGGGGGGSAGSSGSGRGKVDSSKTGGGGGGAGSSGSGRGKVSGFQAKVAGDAGGSAKAGGGGVGGSSGRLPATGGPSLLVFAGALVVAASGAGLMLLRSGRDR